MGRRAASLGPSNGLIAAYLADPFRCTFPGGCNLVSARDVAAGHLLIAEHGTSGESYLLGSQNMTWRQIHTSIAELAGVAPPRMSLNYSLAYLAAAADELRAAHGGTSGAVHARTGRDGRALLLVFARQGGDAGLFAGCRARDALIETDLLAGGVARTSRARPGSRCGFRPTSTASAHAGVTVLKTFRSLVVLKRPQQELWIAMRDHLVEFAGQIADIEEIRQLERSTADGWCVHIVNEWRMRQQVPAMMRSILKIGELSWIDRNTWNAGTFTCTWAIEPASLPNTSPAPDRPCFAEAMGGQGTRVTFEGEFDLKPGLLGSLGGVESLVSGFVESVVTTIIPRNLRAVVEARGVQATA